MVVHHRPGIGRRRDYVAVRQDDPTGYILAMGYCRYDICGDGPRLNNGATVSDSTFPENPVRNTRIRIFDKSSRCPPNQ